MMTNNDMRYLKRHRVMMRQGDDYIAVHPERVDSMIEDGWVKAYDAWGLGFTQAARLEYMLHGLLKYVLETCPDCRENLQYVKELVVTLLTEACAGLPKERAVPMEHNIRETLAELHGNNERAAGRTAVIGRFVESELRYILGEENVYQ